MEVRNIRFPRTVYAIQHNITKKFMLVAQMISKADIGVTCQH